MRQLDCDKYSLLHANVELRGRSQRWGLGSTRTDRRVERAYSACAGSSVAPGMVSGTDSTACSRQYEATSMLLMVYRPELNITSSYLLGQLWETNSYTSR